MKSTLIKDIEATTIDKVTEDFIEDYIIVDNRTNRTDL